MGREVRRVPPDWKHPEGQSLFDGYNQRVERWDRERAKWDEGMVYNYGFMYHGEPNEWKPKSDAALKCAGFEEWDGKRPRPEDYMPDWPAEERTHYQMYETCSEGSPISPVMESPEALARWLADNEASAFGGMTASYEAWLRVCRGGFAPSMVMSGGILASGVEALEALPK